MRNKKYSKPMMLMEQFVPQEYISGCDWEMSGWDPTTQTQLSNSTKFWVDMGVQGVIDETDYDPKAKYNTDGAGTGPAESAVKAWWLAANEKPEQIFNAGDAAARFEVFKRLQDEKKAGYVDAVRNPKNDNNHYYAGAIIRVLNHS